MHIYKLATMLHLTHLYALGTAWSDNPPGINMDLLEKGNKYMIHADMPGYNKSDVHVSIDK